MYLGIWYKRVFGSLSLCSVVGWVGCVKILVSMALLKLIYLNLLLLEDQINHFFTSRKFFFFLVLNRTTCMVCIDYLYYHSQRNFTDDLYQWRRETVNPFAHYDLPVSGHVCLLRGKNSHWNILGWRNFIFTRKSPHLLTNCWLINSSVNEKSL